MVKKDNTIWWVIGVIVVFVILLVVGFFLFEGENEGVSPSKCIGDEDCVKVQIGCCPCNMGGEEKCVPKSEEEYYIEKIENCSVNTICAAVDNCKIKSCDCLGGDCIPDSEGDLVCVPASCCHATACVLESEAPNCSGRFCSMSCDTDLDCGVGRCEYVDGECEVVLNE